MYTPLSIHTHYSLLQAFGKPEEYIKKCVDYGISSIAITDYGLSGSVDFFNEANSAGIKSILGTKVKVDGYYITLIAKNINGWYELIKIVSKQNLSENEELTFNDICELKNVIVIVHSVNGLCDSVITNKSVWINPNPERYLAYFLSSDYESKIYSILEKYKSHFKDSLFIGINRTNEKICSIDRIFNSVLRQAANKYNITVCGIPNTHYASLESSKYQSLLLSIGNKLTIEGMRNKLDSDMYSHYKRFFNTPELVCGHFMSPDEMKLTYSEHEIRNTNLISDMCEKYTILNQPSLPKFHCPDNMSESDYLLKLCRDGWGRIKNKIDGSRLSEYGERVKSELKVLQEANLEGYFLIVQDYVNWVKNQGVLVGPGRGSAAGCLVSYLLGITNIDPIRYGLFFERFYNAGRNSPGKVALPDVDCDFPVFFRENVISYIREKYGEDKVCQVATFGRMQGRMALREILRSMSSCPEDVINSLSKKLPDESKIADKLEEEQETSIIRWTLENEPALLQDYCRIENGNIIGDFAEYFKDAINIEGTYKSYGKHASALIIYDKPIAERCPMLKDKKTSAPLAGIPYEFLEATGIPKFDILGLRTLDVVTNVQSLVKTGKNDSRIKQSYVESEDE